MVHNISMTVDVRICSELKLVAQKSNLLLLALSRFLNRSFPKMRNLFDDRKVFKQGTENDKAEEINRKHVKNCTALIGGTTDRR